MGPFLQFRLWLKEAPKPEIRLFGAIVLALFGLTAWALVPGGIASPAGSQSVPGAFGTQPGLSQPGSQGTTPPGIGSNPTGSAFPGATSSPFRPLGPIATTSGSPPQAFTASDRGVTSGSIKLGFTIINLAGAEQAGLNAAANLRADIRQVIDALVDDANKRGGVLGRRIVAAKASVDLLDPADQQQKCLQLTERDQVFTVIDSYAFLNEAAKACVTIDHKTPLLSNIPGPRKEVERAYPYQISPVDDYNQRVKNWVFYAKASGFFDPSKGFVKLGILSDTCAPSALDDPKIGLKAYLKQVGLKESDWSEHRVNCDIQSQQSAGPAAVLQHRSASPPVSHVFFATIGAGVRNYLQIAQNSQWKPKYGVSDEWGLTSSGTSRGWQADQFDGTRTVTTNHEGELVLGKPLTPMAKFCEKIFTSHGLPKITNYSYDSEALFLCEELQLFIAAATRAGPYLTRPIWAQALQTVGEFRPSFGDLALFNKPGKVTGGDSIAVIEWRKQCTCYVQIRGFKPAY